MKKGIFACWLILTLASCEQCCIQCNTGGPNFFGLWKLTRIENTDGSISQIDSTGLLYYGSPPNENTVTFMTYDSSGIVDSLAQKSVVSSDKKKNRQIVLFHGLKYISFGYEGSDLVVRGPASDESTLWTLPKKIYVLIGSEKPE